MVSSVTGRTVRCSEYQDGSWTMHHVDNTSGKEWLCCYNETYRLKMNIPDYSLNADGSYREVHDPPFRATASSRQVQDSAPHGYTDWGAATHRSVATRNTQRRNQDGTYSPYPHS